ncbi:hypothetical protein [Natrialba aegyptia]|uniref:Zincin peptidase n=1 Tax=Natrialba aegyptia DSM 13077 TaxID=1227491 RepID=M0AYU1_9EURY|nr:hypothetical protein [Natrialba aegyptia]ELZ03680.1 hypothetical protein C480_14985 [Natrialba aegyptia DSM 13077]
MEVALDQPMSGIGIGLDVVFAGVALVVTVVLGLVAHEWTHALVLWGSRIEFTISYLPGRTDGITGVLASCPWAVVRPRPNGTEPPWVLRVAALAPLALALPIFVFGFGVAPAPVALVDSPVGTAIAIGWLACAIPSPQDFSAAFYAHRVLETKASTAESVSRAK